MTLKRSTLAAFAAPCLPVAAAGLPFVVYLPPYYAGPLGLSLSVVGALFLIVRLIDVPLDPLIGHAIDRTMTRFGRYKPWILVAAALMSVGVALVFLAPPGITAFRAMVGLLTMYIAYSALALAITAWGATLSDDYHERSRVFGWWQMGNIIGMVLLLLVPPLTAHFNPDPSHSSGIHMMGWLVLIALPLTVALQLRVVPERNKASTHVHKLSDLIGIFKVPLLGRLMLVDLLAGLAAGIAGALLMFYFQAVRGFSGEQAGLLLLIYFCAGLAAAPFWIWLSRKTSKHRTLMISLVIYGVMQACLLILPSGTFLESAIAMALAGTPYAAAAFLLRAMLADLSDHHTLRTGQHQTGLFFAALTATNKVAYALAVGMTYPILDAIGFVATKGVNNSPQALSGLMVMFTLPPAVLLLIGAVIVARWPIDAAEQARIAAKLARGLSEPDLGATPSVAPPAASPLQSPAQ
jgi:Na+/melibiose symporter-like transporter